MEKEGDMSSQAEQWNTMSFSLSVSGFPMSNEMKTVGCDFDKILTAWLLSSSGQQQCYRHSSPSTNVTEATIVFHESVSATEMRIS